MIARVFVMNINNADDLPATDQRNRQERFVGVFGQGCKGLKARVFPGSRRQRHNRLVFRYPSRYALQLVTPTTSAISSSRIFCRDMSELTIALMRCNRANCDTAASVEFTATVIGVPTPLGHCTSTAASIYQRVNI